MDDRLDEHVERPVTPFAAGFWTITLALLVGICVSVTQSLRPGAESDVVNLTACEVLATSLVIFLMARLYARETPLRKALSFRPIGPLSALLALAAGAGLSPPLSMLEDWVLRRWPIHDEEILQSLDKIVASSRPAVLVVAMLVVIPVARELFFRGMLYTSLRRSSGVLAAFVVTVICYSCAQLQAQYVPSLAILGLAMAWLGERSGTVLAPILAQIAYGAVQGIPILRGADPGADVTYPKKWIIGGAIVALLALVAVGTSKREEPST